jgi:RecJ-like exonuclease
MKAKRKQIPSCPFCEGKGKLFYFPYPGEADCKYCGGTGKMWSFVRNVGDQLLEYLSEIDDPDLRALLPKLGDVIDEIVAVTREEGDAGKGER